MSALKDNVYLGNLKRWTTLVFVVLTFGLLGIWISYAIVNWIDQESALFLTFGLLIYAIISWYFGVDYFGYEWLSPEKRDDLSERLPFFFLARVSIVAFIASFICIACYSLAIGLDLKASLIMGLLYGLLFVMFFPVFLVMLLVAVSAALSDV